MIRALSAGIARRLGDETLGAARFVAIDHGWSLAVWPVTNRLYAGFIDDNGYLNQRWWDREGWRWRQTPASSRRKDRPDRWGSAGYAHPLLAVRGLSVHEARAFVRWYAATVEPRAALPPRAIWVAAAASVSQASPPPDPTVRKYAPVACAPHLASAQGVEDLGGLVREWLDDGDGRAISAGYAWCDEPVPLKDSIQDHSHDGRRWYHPFGLRLALKPR